MDKTYLIHKIIKILEDCDVDVLVYIELFLRRLTHK